MAEATRQGASRGGKVNYGGVLAGIVAFTSLIMPWWNVTMVVPALGLGNSTAVDSPLYLYQASAGVLASPTQVVSLNLWFCWATLGLVALAGILAIAGSAMSGRGRLILVVGGAVALVSIVVFAAGLQTELLSTGSGLDLFKTASGTWGTLTAYLSFGFWGALVAAATMLAAARTSRVMTTAPYVTVQSHAQDGAPTILGFAEFAQQAPPDVHSF